jgi:tetratricopeptide (TPR) repeat protein
MNLADERLRGLEKQIQDTPTRNQRALLRCRFASELVHVGKYDAAQEVLGPLWQGIGKRPEITNLSTAAQAETLLQCGVLSGWLGSAKQIPHVQEKAKDLLFEALRIFQSQNNRIKVAEAKYELGMCYWRLGAFDESRDILKEALKGLEDTDLKAKTLIRRTLVEIWTGRYHDALKILDEAESFFMAAPDAVKGRWHGQRALVLRRLGVAEKRNDYFDRAIIEFTAAIFHFEQARHERYCAVAENNLAHLLSNVGRFKEAHDYLDRATKILSRLQDEGFLAQVNETRARILVAEKRYQEASRMIAGVVKKFEQCGEQALLADALIWQAIIQARLKDQQSFHTFQRAINIAENAGALSSAGFAALSLIEEHSETLSEYEIYHIYERADSFLKDTQDVEEIARLRACARIVTKKLLGPQLGDKDFHLTKLAHAYEAKFIEQALERAGGIVTRAAKLLGFKHHGSLTNLLKRRHKNLTPKRTPAKQRKRSYEKRR